MAFARKLVLLFALFAGAFISAAQAAPLVSMYFTPATIDTGGVSRLQINIYDFAPSVSGGVFSLTYPVGVSNAASPNATSTCVGVITALPAVNIISGTGIGFGFEGCTIEVDVTSAAVGLQTVTFPANAFSGSSGFGPSTATSAVLAVTPPLIVTNANDSGPGSLREMLTFARDICPGFFGGGYIRFAIPGAGPHTIMALDELPSVICDGTFIDGYTQPGSQQNGAFDGTNDAVIKVAIDGTNCAGCNRALLFDRTGEIRGLAIHSFPSAILENTSGNARIMGNYLGTDPGGMTARGSPVGIRVIQGQATIGDGSPQGANLISGNGIGVELEERAYISGNIIGGNRAGAAGGMGNTTAAVMIFSTTGSTTEHNFIRHNNAGIVVNAAALGRNVFSMNLAWGNGGPGIDLGGDGHTPNDEPAAPPYDLDTGPNRLMNYPVVTSVTHVGPDTRIDGYVKSEGGVAYVELYDNTVMPPAGRTEGEKLIGTTTVDLEPGSGFGTFSVTVPGLAQHVSAAATIDWCGDGCTYSSEYSPAVAASAAAPQTVVVNTGSSGPGSLIDAINYVNANCATSKVITFDITGTAPYQIELTTALPMLTCDGTLIDGYTQPGASANSLEIGSNANILVEIDGSDIGSSGGFRINAADVLIKGLAIHSFQNGAAITVMAPSGTMGIGVHGNFIGINGAGQARPNRDGIVNVSGATGLAIGDFTTEGRNVISSNNGLGISLNSGDATQIAGNYIGTDPSGSAARPNRAGIEIVDATNTLVANNVISGNGYEGSMAGIIERATGSRYQGNHIGTDAFGVAAIPNDVGIRFVNSLDASLGDIEAPNLVSGNRNEGIRIDTSSDISIRGNYIGTDATGVAPLGNGVGIVVDTSTNVRIGTLGGNSNVIGFNAGAGVDVYAGDGVAINRNSIFQNGGGGITLGGVIPPNDACDTDTGPNDQQNAPVLDLATSGGSVSGTATGRANALLRIEFFAEPGMVVTSGRLRVRSADPRPRFLGSIDVNVGPGCSAPFTTTFEPLNADDIVSATATDASNNTSPFSNDMPVAAPPPPALSCSIIVFDTATGDTTAALPGDVIVTPGGSVGLSASCNDYTGVTFVWGHGDTNNYTTVTAPPAGGSATHSVTATGPSGTSSASKTILGAVAGAPLCTITTTANNPVPPGSTGPFDMTASCAPPATAMNWMEPTVLAGQGTTAATLQFEFTLGAGYGYTVLFAPTNAAGSGPIASRLIWVQPMALSASSLDFPDTENETQSAAQSITVSNLSDYYQAFPGIGASGPFAFEHNCPAPIPPGTTCTIEVRFTPLSVGPEQVGTLTLSTGFPGNSDLQVFLFGNGTPGAPGAPSIAVSTNSLTFAARTILTTSSPQSVTFSNDGSAPFNFDTASTTGDFAVSHDCGSEMPPGDSCGLDVTFTPLTEGPRTGQLLIHTDLEGTPHVVSLSGAGVANTVPSAALIPGTLEFAPQLLGTQSAVQFITVLNDGTAPLVFGAMSASGDFALVLDFISTVGPCGGTLAPGAQCEVGAAFRPTVAGVREGAIAINTNAPEPVSTLRLVGTGLVTAPARMLSVPSSLAFDAQRVGTRSPGRALAITNNFPSIASITELTATGDFSVSDTCTTIAARGSCAPLVTFLPRAVGPRSGTLTIRALSEIQPYVVQLTGLGEANPQPALEASITQASFGNAFVGAAGAPVSFNLRNIGQVPVVISGIAPLGDFFVTHACTTIAAGDSCQVTIFFAPHATGRLTGSLFVHSNAEASPLRIDLSGIGCSIPSATRARFGGVLCGP